MKSTGARRRKKAEDTNGPDCDKKSKERERAVKRKSRRDEAEAD